MRELAIRDDMIRLGQALKLAGLAASGGEARALIEQGADRRQRRGRATARSPAAPRRRRDVG
jgi:ribosome-associated protein